MNMKKPKKLLSIILTLCMILSLLPVTALADTPPVVIGTTGYNTLTDALAAAVNGDTIKLQEDVSESVTYAVYAGKTITIDGGGHTVTAPDSTTESVALALSGTGTVILKDLTLQGGASPNGSSIGLKTGDSVNIRSYGTVTANGSAATATSSYGVTNSGTGTVDVTEAVASGLQSGFGAYNTGSGTINVGSATGNGAMNGMGAFNLASGTINVTTADGSSSGVFNLSFGTVNVTTATGSSYGVYNGGTGAINAATVAATAQGGVAVNNDHGAVNVKTITSGTFTTTTNMNVASITLNIGTGASCVLDAITVAASGATTVGALPSVYNGINYSKTWYTDSAKTTAFSGTTVTGAANLYSSYYEAPKMVEITKNSTTTYYPTLSDALAAAADGDVIVLNENITESVSYTVSANKTVTVDGNNHTLSGTASADSAALSLDGTGTVILKNLTLQSNASSGTSTGLDVSGSVSVQSYGTVTANGSAATAISSYGVSNSGTGTVDVTEAVAAGWQLGFGTYNTGSGTINVGSATGSGPMNGAGAYNKAGGTINVATASGNRNGVINLSSGTVNVTTATNTDAADTLGSAINNVGTGTVNAGTASGGLHGVSNSSTGTVNAGTITGDTTNSGGGAVNTGAAVTSIPLHVGTGTSCVLDSITIANSGSTIGTLPDVYQGSVCSAQWYIGVALSNLFTMQEISSEATLYSSFYTIETAEDVAAYITEVSGLTASASGSTVTVTGTATLTSTSDAALTFDIPADVTVVWKASLTGGGSKYLLEPTGDGTFEVADGADIVNNACQTAIYCYDGKGNLNVTGGKVSTTVGNGMAIGIAGDWLLTMTGGEVSANAANSCAIFGKNPVVITGGTVSATDASGYQLYMGDTSVYRSGVLDSSKIMYHDSGVFAEVCVGAAVTQAVYGTSTGLTVTGHNLSTDSVTAVWTKQSGVSGVNISYFSATDTTNAYETEFLAVPGVMVTTTYTVTFNKNGGDTEASPMTKTVASGGTVDALPTAPTRSGYTFTGWNTAADGSGAAYTASVIIKSDITVYAQWSKNSSTGGGSSPTTPAPTTTVSGSTATTTMTPTVSGGIASGSVTTSQMSDALAKAKTAAGTSGTPDVKIQIDGASGASSVGTTIPQASVQALVSGGVGALTISGPTGSVRFGADALKTISGAASGDVTVTVAKTDSSALSDAAKQAVGGHPVFTFSVTSGGKTISQFGGTATVSVRYTPAAGEDTNAIVIYYIGANGELETVTNGRYDAATGTVVFTTTHFSTYAVGYNKVSFSDVSDTAWYSKAVTFLAARGVTSGTTVTTFSPDVTLTRGQFITMLLRAYGISADASATDNFSDAGDTYCTGYLAAAKKLGITSGIGDNKFAPDKAITRQEMFTMLYNALKVLDKLPEGASSKTLSDFMDSGSVASWATDAMTALVKTGTVSGSSGKLIPTCTTTRAEMAQVLYNLLGK